MGKCTTVSIIILRTLLASIEPVFNCGLRISNCGIAQFDLRGDQNKESYSGRADKDDRGVHRIEDLEAPDWRSWQVTQPGHRGGNRFTRAAFGWLVAGERNVIDAVGASVSGGGLNTASGEIASVSGGFQNSASGNSASVSGGVNNVASVLFASVAGGVSNTAGGEATIVPDTMCLTEREAAAQSKSFCCR